MGSERDVLVVVRESLKVRQKAERGDGRNMEVEERERET